MQHAVWRVQHFHDNFKNIGGKIQYFAGILKATGIKGRIRIRIRNPVYGSKDPEPSQFVTDPEHWLCV